MISIPWPPLLITCSPFRPTDLPTISYATDLPTAGDSPTLQERFDDLHEALSLGCWPHENPDPVGLQKLQAAALF